MSNILVVGCGQLGSRHLQSLCTLESSHQLLALEPSDQSWEACQKVLANDAPKVSRVDGYKNLPPKIDLAIIATSADIRPKIVTNLLSQCHVSSLVLEKVLCQSVADLHTIDETINRHKTKAWVNCPRRMFPFYQELKASLGSERHIAMSFTGRDWGMGCNSIHMMDLCAYLAGSQGVESITGQLYPEILETKRSGFKEVHGSLRIEYDHHTSLSLSCDPHSSESPPLLTIQTEDRAWFIREAEGFCQVQDKQSGFIQDCAYEGAYQSQLTGPLAEEIFATGSCQLTSLAESLWLHRPFLDFMAHEFSVLDHKYQGFAPIT